MNSELLPGPNLTNTLLGVLMKFREESKGAIIGDIKAIFHQETIRQNFYVDDCFNISATVEEAMHLTKDLCVKKEVSHWKSGQTVVLFCRPSQKTRVLKIERCWIWILISFQSKELWFWSGVWKLMLSSLT